MIERYAIEGQDSLEATLMAGALSILRRFINLKVAPIRCIYASYWVLFHQALLCCNVRQVFQGQCAMERAKSPF